VLVADHHLLVDHPSPRPAHLIRAVILHNSTGSSRILDLVRYVHGAYCVLWIANRAYYWLVSTTVRYGTSY
jgi:hypothetical protein